MSQSKALDFFLILDFDRTLASPDALRLCYEEIVIEQTPISGEEIANARQRFRHGFNLVAFIRQLLAHYVTPDACEVLMKRIGEEFVAEVTRHTSTFLEPGAKEFLQQLQRDNLSFGIMTTGGEEWQELKIKAVGLSSLPCLVVATSDKGTLIRAWEREGGYLVPQGLSSEPILARRLGLIDDKAESFTNLPVDVLAVHVLYDQSVGSHGQVPAHVLKADSLDEAWRLICARISTN